MQVEKASFTLLVFMKIGGMGKECALFNKRLASMIAEKTKEQYLQVMGHIRTRLLRFALLKSTLVAARGYRGKSNSAAEREEDEIDFNLIPEETTYETY